MLVPEVRFDRNTNVLQKIDVTRDALRQLTFEMSVSHLKRDFPTYKMSSGDDADKLPSAEVESVDRFFKSPDFYKNAQFYWSNVAPTVDGMLGGLSMIAPTDIQGSKQFLDEIFKMKPSPGRGRSLDCGAGIGRVAKNLLSHYFNTVDLVEQDKGFIAKAREFLSENGVDNPKVGQLFNAGLQTFIPDQASYDVIWSQWVLGHLTDGDLVSFFKRCSAGLAPNGCLVIKENFTSTDDFCIDNVDSSVTRSVKVTKALLEAADLRVFRITKQQNFIQGLFPVYIIACKPVKK